jgi:hypothetical protein
MTSRRCLAISNDDPHQRALQNGSRTCVAADDLPPPPPFHEAFFRHYDRIRKACESTSEPGIVCVAANAAGLVRVQRLPAQPDAVHCAILGRHKEADIWMGEDPRISLRHLALIVFPHEEGYDPRFRLLDLRTATAMTDELGRRLESLEAEGAVFVHCGSCAILLFPTSERIPWPDGAEQGWACIPERVYFAESAAEPDRWVRRPRRPTHIPPARRLSSTKSKDGSQGAATMVQTTRAPKLARQQKLLEKNESPVGMLMLQAGEASDVIEVGGSALADGVLLGRYDRCDNHRLDTLANRHISRVHLLLVEIDNKVLAIDTASTNGTKLADEQSLSRPLGKALADEPVCVLEMSKNSALVLAGCVTATWSPGRKASTAQ